MSGASRLGGPSSLGMMKNRGQGTVMGGKMGFKGNQMIQNMIKK